jgi:hypothetical protein
MPDFTLTELPAVSGVPRDGRGRPLVVPRAGGRPRALVRTTTHVDAIEDKSTLATWGKRMTLVGTARQGPSFLATVCNLNPDLHGDKAALDALAERAVNAAGAHRKRDRGTYLHSLSEYVDRGAPLPATATSADVADMAAYKLATVSFDVQAVEQFLVVDELGVGGTADRIAWYSGPGPDGEPFTGHVITDLKTGSVQYGALKMAAQLAVYSRGELYDHTRFPVDQSDEKAFAAWKKTEVSTEEAAAAYRPLPPVSRDWGVIIHLPAGEGTCTLYWADLRIGWEAANLASEIRRLRRVKTALRSFAETVASARPSV